MHNSGIETEASENDATLKDLVNKIAKEYCEKLIEDIRKEGINDKVNEGIRMIHHLVQIDGKIG